MNEEELLIRNVSSRKQVSFPLNTRMLLIGKSADNDLVIEGDSVPDCAAKIEPSGSGFQIEAIGKGQICVNGKKVKSSSLKPGDRLEINSHIFIIDNHNPAPALPPRISDTDLLHKIYLLVNAVGRERDLKKLLQNLLSTLVEITEGAEIFIFKIDRDGNPQVFVTTSSGSSQELFSDTVVQQVLSQGKGIFIPNALSDPSFKNSNSIADLHLFSIMCTPIKIAGKVLGLIYVGSRMSTVSFSGSDLEYLDLYASIAGMLINHVEYISQQSSAFLRFSGKLSEEGIIAESKIMQDLLLSLSSIAASDISVLLEGETGTGKSKIAQYIHKKSIRSEKPFVVVNCSALRGELLESELFGHKKGSFTGAIDDHEGLFASANGGTVFLDEIGELDLQLQAKLLRTLETGTVRPIGSTREFSVNVRIICATNRNLTQMVDQGAFRADLFYRINQFGIEIPPLRKRDDDLILLAYFFLEQYKALYPSKDIFDFHPDTLNFIKTCTWPGNIRELSNCIHRAVITSQNPLVKLNPQHEINTSSLDFESATKAFQKDLIQKTIQCAGGNKEEAVRKLGLSRSTFYRYYSHLGL